jgi:hypothetical protein
VAVLWNYEPPPPNPHAAGAEAAPSARPPARPALVAAEEAERAWKQAAAECLEAQNAYQQALRQYGQALKDLAGNRITREAVSRYLAKLQEQAQVVQQKQRVLTEKTRLREEARQALLRDRP